jgi:thiamine-phosphate pyrophosphorylase
MKRFDLSLYLVLDPVLCVRHTMVETAVAAVAGGATVVQLRHKSATTAQRIELGWALQAALRDTRALLVVNDDVEAAVAIDADGLHIGQGDISPAEARRLIGPDMVLGLSAGTRADIDGVDQAVVDYIGVGPVFGTATKPDHAAPIGLDGLERLLATTSMPAVAIGGLKLEHVAAVLKTGAAGLAVVSAICGMPDPGQAAREFSERIRVARSNP